MGLSDWSSNLVDISETVCVALSRCSLRRPLMAEFKPITLLLFWAAAALLALTGTGPGVPASADAATSDPYCFSLTWLGPSWNNDSQGNGSCKHLKDTPEVCMDPLVITYDSTPPNMTYIWKKYHKTEIGCRLTDNEACVKFTYYYNGNVENITYMCARITVDNEYSMTSGCESADVGGYVKEVCACRTYPGADFPCNHAAHLPLPALALLVLVAVALVPLFRPHIRNDH